MTYQDNLQAFFHDHGQIEHKPSLNKPHIDFEVGKDSQEKTLYEPKPPKQCMKNEKNKQTKNKTKQKQKNKKKLVIALNIQLVITNYPHHKHLITDNC